MKMGRNSALTMQKVVGMSREIKYNGIFLKPILFKKSSLSLIVVNIGNASWQRASYFW